MKFFENALNPQTLNTLAHLSNINFFKNYYLAGGTACALQIGHRTSADLDFFSPKPYSNEEIIKALVQKKPKILDEKKDTLHLIVRNIKVSFLGYPYPLLKEPLLYKGARVASLADIGCMKISAASSRGTKRDFIDLFEICNHKIPLTKLLELFRVKYKDTQYSLPHILKSLAFFEDAESDPDPVYLHKELKWEAVKEFFETQVRELSLELLA